MTEMYPAYYEAFRCTAGACRHNCCIGWEIDIDGKSAARYAALPGAFGERVRAAVEPDDPPHFRLDAAGRCAMLRDDNLCDLQRTLGESVLCNICRDHPRYRVVSARADGDRAGALLRGGGAAAAFPDRKGDASRRGIESAAARDRGAAALPAEAAGRRAGPAAHSRRTDAKMLTLAGASLPRRTARAWAAFFASLEPLEPGWTEALAKLAGPVDFAGFHAVSAAWETEYEQLLVYFLLRHLLADEGRALPARAAFAVLSTAMLYALGAAVRTENGALSFGERVELARLWSANVEYSEENMRAALDGLT